MASLYVATKDGRACCQVFIHKAQVSLPKTKKKASSKEKTNKKKKREPGKKKAHVCLFCFLCVFVPS